MGIGILCLQPHLHNGLTSHGRGTGIFLDQHLKISAICGAPLSSAHTISFLLQAEQKIAFPFVQIHAFGK